MSDLRGPLDSTGPTRMLLDQLADKWSVLVLIALSTHQVSSLAPKMFDLDAVPAGRGPPTKRLHP